jgi:hypothetical protein
MATTEEQAQRTEAVYSMEGTLLEACSCDVLCPCWIGEDPDQGDCRGLISYYVDHGQIQGVDVSGLAIVIALHIPGNVLAGNWEVVLLVDDKATPEQEQALVAAHSGALGGPLADLAGLIGTVKGVERASISHEVRGGEGSLSIKGILEAEMAPYRSANGDVTTIRDSIFTTVPGSPAWVSKASKHHVTLPQYGFEWEFEGRNAIQSDWKMEYVA